MVKTKNKQGKKSEDPLNEMKDLLLRTQASFENYRKQTEKRMEEMQKMASREVILQVLPLLDNFNLALKNANCNPEEFKKGVELIYSQFFNVLEDNGVESIKTDDEMFDPYYHEALMKMASDLPENMIIEEFQKGFLLNGTVIRHSKVKISAGNVDEKKSTEDVENNNSEE